MTMIRYDDDTMEPRHAKKKKKKKKKKNFDIVTFLLHHLEMRIL